MDCGDLKYLRRSSEVSDESSSGFAIGGDMSKAGTSAVKVEFIPVSLKSVYPIIPRKDEEKLQLVDDLTKMGCEGLIVEPWEVKSEAMV